MDDLTYEKSEKAIKELQKLKSEPDEKIIETLEVVIKIYEENLNQKAIKK